ncbi:MAG TPA: decarboxylating 6-phosphogluconate dehydrogenase [Candidatus Polarisedimenticolia bacterium]|nr:decarboxylating 6-phosphogluconate dehydrogenase [Candidatus Polarisedimenticolia bacterium]
MKLGMVGLGRMGGNMTRRLMRAGHELVVYARSAESVRSAAAEGAQGSFSLQELVQALPPPRAVWVMIPAGAPTESTVRALGGLLEADDTVVDGGNSFFKDDVRRAAALREKGIHYVDVGTSGGVWGVERGYCLMIGGPRAAVERLDPIFRALAPGRAAAPPTPGRARRPDHIASPSSLTVPSNAEEGYLHCGPAGAGHFVKMIHNGIEYGAMQAYAEGFDILKSAAHDNVPEAQRYDLDLGEIAELWRRGSVVSSWLLDLTAQALAASPRLEEFEGVVEDSGEGRWTVQTAIEEAVPADVLSAALYARFRSRQSHTFAEKILSAMRAGFGGHIEPGKKHP